MDIRIEKKKGIRALFTKKGIPYLAGALFLLCRLMEKGRALQEDSDSII